MYDSVQKKHVMADLEYDQYAAMVHPTRQPIRSLQKLPTLCQPLYEAPRIAPSLVFHLVLNQCTCMMRLQLAMKLVTSAHYSSRS